MACARASLPAAIHTCQDLYRLQFLQTQTSNRHCSDSHQLQALSSSIARSVTCLVYMLMLTLVLPYQLALSAQETVAQQPLQVPVRLSVIRQDSELSIGYSQTFHNNPSFGLALATSTAPPNSVRIGKRFRCRLRSSWIHFGNPHPVYACALTRAARQPCLPSRSCTMPQKYAYQVCLRCRSSPEAS
jgi:hypothetical protein